MFKELIADLGALAAKAPDLTKSQTIDPADTKIADAGATGGDSGDGGEGSAGNGDGDGAGGSGEGGGDGDGDDLTKSFEVTLENGKKFQAVDASEMLKALTTRQDEIETSTGEALGMCVTLLKSLSADNERLSGIVTKQDEALRKLAGTGAGRQAVVAVLGKVTPGSGGGSDLVKSNVDKGMKPAEFLLKAEAQFNAGRLDGRQLAHIETIINRGEQMPAEYIQKVVGTAAA